jgi:hypothetical protein
VGDFVDVCSDEQCPEQARQRVAVFVSASVIRSRAMLVGNCLGLFDACPWLQNSRRMRAGVEQTSREETAESGDAGDAGYGD